MDCRLTLKAKEGFFTMLQEAFENQSKVALLVDENGLERYEGKIKTLTPSHLVLESGMYIGIDLLTAVNGVFVSDFSEC